MLYRLRVALGCALLLALTGVAVQAILLLHAAHCGQPVRYRGPFPGQIAETTRRRPGGMRSRSTRQRVAGGRECPGGGRPGEGGPGPDRSWTGAPATCWRAWMRAITTTNTAVADGEHAIVDRQRHAGGNP